MHVALHPNVRCAKNSIIRCWVDPCCHVVYAGFWPYHLNAAAEIETCQIRQCFSNLLLPSSDEPVQIVTLLSCSYLTGVAHGMVLCCSPSSSRCYAFRDGILYFLVVKSGWVTFAFLSSWTNLPSSVSTNAALSPTQLPLRGADGFCAKIQVE